MVLLNYSELSPDELKQVDRKLIPPEDVPAYCEALEAVVLPKDYEDRAAPDDDLPDDKKDELFVYLRAQLPKVDPPDSDLQNLAFTMADLLTMASDQYKVSEDRVKTLIEEMEREKSLKVTADIGSGNEQSGTHYQTYFENNPERGIRLITKKIPRDGGDPRYQDDIILSYFIDRATKVINPLEPGDMTYSVRLRHCRKRRAVMTYDDVSIGEISAHVGNTAQGVRSKSRLHEAISSLIDGMDEEGLVKEENRIPATGFFEYKGGLHWSESKIFKCTLPEYKERQTKRGLNALEKVADFYAVRGIKDGDHLQHFLPALYFIVQAPLSVIRKAAGGEAKVLLLQGQAHTGKTYLEKISCAIWGIPPSSGIIGASRLTAPQYAEAVNRCTLPISFDESRNALSSPAIADLIKSSTMNLLIKNRITRDFKMRSFMAYAAVLMSTNYVPDLYVGMADRLISIIFTRQHKREERDVRTFEAFFNGDGKAHLSHIGSGLRYMYLDKWETCKRLVSQDDELKAGRELLMMLYREHGLPVPDWMVEVKAADSRPEEDDPLKIVFDWMREDILRVLRQNKRMGGEVPTEWIDRLDIIQQDNLLPAYIRAITKDNIYVTKELLREIAGEGFELPGGLTGLLHVVNDHPAQVSKNDTVQNKLGAKTVKIERNLFYLYADKSDIQLEIE